MAEQTTKPKWIPPNAGKGRVKGVPNKTTKNAREAIARLVDGNAERMQQWLDEIARNEGPLQAWKCMTDVIEYHVPKLSRSEVTGANGGPLAVTTDIKAIDAEILALVAANPELKALLK